MTQARRAAVSCALLLGTGLLLQLRAGAHPVGVRKSLDAFPGALGEWRMREDATFDARTINILHVKDYLMRRYEDRSGRSIWLYLAFWETQRRGATTHSPKNCLPGSGWEPIHSSRVQVRLGPSRAPISVNAYLVSKGNHRQLVYYWYMAQGRAFAGEVTARLAMVSSAILHDRTDGALVRVSSPVYGSESETGRMLARYIETLYPALDQHLPD